MAISLRSYALTKPIYTAALVINLPTGAQAGDVLVAHIVCRLPNNSGLTLTPPAGWTEVTGTFAGNGGDAGWAGNIDVGQWAFTKVAGASEPSSYTFTWSVQPSGTNGGAISAWTGVDNTTPVDASELTGATNTATPAAPSVSPSSSAAMLLSLFAGENGVTITYPADETSAYDAGNTSGYTAQFGLSYKQLSASGATGTETATLSSSDYSTGTSIALKPAATNPTVSFVQQTTAASSPGATSLAFPSITAAAGDLLLVQATAYDSNAAKAALTITDDNGNTWAQVGTTDFYAAPNCNAGATVVTITPSGGTGAYNIAGNLSEWNNAESASPVDTSNDGTAALEELTTSDPDDLIVTGGTSDNTASTMPTFTAGSSAPTSGWTALTAAQAATGKVQGKNYDYVSVAAQYQMVSALGTYGGYWTNISTNSVIALKAAGTGGAVSASATSASSSGASASASAARPVTASSADTSAASASPSASRPISASFSDVSTAAGSAGASRAAASTSASTSTASGTISRLRGVGSTLASVTMAAASASATRIASAASASVSAVSAIASVAGNAIAAVASIVSSSAASGGASVTRAIASVLASSSGTAASGSAARPATASFSDVSTASGSIAASRSATAASASVSSSSGIVAVLRGAASTLASTSTLSAIASVTGAAINAIASIVSTSSASAVAFVRRSAASSFASDSGAAASASASRGIAAASGAVSSFSASAVRQAVASAIAAAISALQALASVVGNALAGGSTITIDTSLSDSLAVAATLAESVALDATLAESVQLSMPLEEV